MSSSMVNFHTLISILLDVGDAFERQPDSLSTSHTSCGESPSAASDL